MKFSWDSTVITWPRNPKSIVLKSTSITKSLTKPGSKAMLLSYGKKPDVLTLEGLLYEKGKTASYLISTYISPMLSRVYKEVTISELESNINGAWILASFLYRKIGGYPNVYTYKMEFYKGSEHHVME